MPHTKVRVNSGLFTFLPQPGMVDLIITTGFLAVANNLGDVFSVLSGGRSPGVRPPGVRAQIFSLTLCLSVCLSFVKTIDFFRRRYYNCLAIPKTVYIVKATAAAFRLSLKKTYSAASHEVGLIVNYFKKVYL